MRNDEVKILDEQWDYLVVLDACRYDYFERMYKKFFDKGTLSKKISKASHTSEWLRSNFREYVDLVYVSSNPHINSNRAICGFSAKQYFFKVYDIWHTHWNKKLDTVEPDILTEQAIKIVNRHHDKKAIIHYMQPHEPYLTCKHLSSVSRYEVRDKQNPVFYFIYRCLNRLMLLFGIKSHLVRWRIMRLLRLEIPSQIYRIVRSEGPEALKDYYEANLRCVLSSVKNLVGQLGGRIVITSDHGEMLGEKGLYGHWPGANQPELREVPWLVIDKPKKDVDVSGEVEEQEPEAPDATDEEIKEKLRHLGYL
ncbi:MAG: hypothetical protein KAS75_07745 [Planctomycetes bacterium]|nr:hypothetical protein [Planctomycetota bacterium]